MVEPCGLWEFALNCELSNNMAMTFELTLALIFGSILAVGFYRKEQKDRKKLDKIIENEAEFRKKRTRFALKKLLNGIEEARSWIPFPNEIVSFDPKDTEEYRKDMDMTPIDAFDYAIFLFKELNDIVELYSDNLDPESIEIYTNFRKDLRFLEDDSSDDHKDRIVSRYDQVQSDFENIIQFYTNKMNSEKS